jgi:long-chain fatty acid transport protein
MRNHAHRRGFLFVSAIAATLWASNASASGFSTARFGAELGHPISSNPTAIYYNPAGIASSEHGYQLYLDLSVALRSASFEHRSAPSDVPEPAGAQGANTDKAKLFNVLAVPMLGATARFGNLAFGAGVYVPFGGTSVWDKNDRLKSSPYAGVVDGGSRWYSIEGTIQSTYYTAAAAYRFGDSGLSLGLSGNLINSVVKTIRARVSDGSNDIGAEGRSFTDTKGWHGSFGVGAMYEAVKNALWFGASYQAQPGVSGGMTLKGTLDGYFAGSESKNKVRIEQTLPDVFRLGARYRVNPALELRLFGDYTRWSVFEQQCLGEEDKPCVVAPDGSKPPSGSGVIQNLPRHWQDAWAVRLGASLWPIESLELMAGVGYDSNAIPDKALDPALMDYHDVMAALGARYRIIKQLFGGVTVTQFFYVPRDTTGKNGNAAWQPPSRGPDAGGKYSQSTTVINVNTMLAF